MYRPSYYSVVLCLMLFIFDILRWLPCLYKPPSNWLIYPHHGHRTCNYENVRSLILKASLHCDKIEMSGWVDFAQHNVLLNVCEGVYHNHMIIWLHPFVSFIMTLVPFSILDTGRIELQVSGAVIVLWAAQQGIFFGCIGDCAALCHRSYLESSNYANPDYPRKDLHLVCFFQLRLVAFPMAALDFGRFWRPVKHTTWAEAIWWCDSILSCREPKFRDCLKTYIDLELNLGIGNNHCIYVQYMMIYIYITDRCCKHIVT